MACFRCPECFRRYPLREDFRKCALCEVPNKSDIDKPTLSIIDAAAFARKAEFHHAHYREFQRLSKEKGLPTPEDRARGKDTWELIYASIRLREKDQIEPLDDLFAAAPALARRS